MSDRQGRQTPTTSVVLPYQETKGLEAIEIYNRTPIYPPVFAGVCSSLSIFPSLPTLIEYYFCPKHIIHSTYFLF